MQKPASLSLRWVAALTGLGGTLHVEWVAGITGIHSLSANMHRLAGRQEWLVKMELTDEQKVIQEKALQFARKNKNQIADFFTDRSIYPTEGQPVSVFMAGSPGAGKTEASIELLKRFAKDGFQVLRIDPDELRLEFEDYAGDNSWLFQGAVSILVSRILDLAFKHQQSFLLDGTLTNFQIAEQNIMRSLKKGRVVQILYVYQKPELAWEFVQARELIEGRRIRPENFIHQYFAAREVVNDLKRNFEGKIRVDLLLKNNDNSDKLYKAGIDQIDFHVPENYTRTELERMIDVK